MAAYFAAPLLPGDSGAWLISLVLIVGGAAWNEWKKAQARTAAQSLGDEILTALDTEAPEERSQALAGIGAEAEAAAVARLLAA